MTIPDLPLIGVIIAACLLLFWKHFPDFKSPHTDSEKEYGIETIINEVKSELVRADLQTRRSGQSPLFKLGGFDLEINFVIRSKEVSKGEFKPELVAVSMESEASREKTQKITLHLTPLPTEGLSVPAASEPNPKETESPTVVHGQTPPARDKTSSKIQQ